MSTRASILYPLALTVSSAFVASAQPAPGLRPGMGGPPPQVRPGGGGGGGGRGSGTGRQGQQGNQAAQTEYRPEELCTVGGVVRNAATGEPLSKASITLSMGGGGTGGGGGGGRPRPTYAASTGADGRFSIKGVEPGQYRVAIRRNGFVSTEMTGRRAITPSGSLNLSKGQSISNIEAKLAPHAVITGRVTDADGEPIVYASVQVLRYRFNQQGQRELTETGAASTNDLGEYRLFGIPAGRYVVSVVARDNRFAPFMDVRGGERDASDSPVTTYYPGSTDSSQATAIDVATGAAIQGIDVRVQRARTFNVSGQIIGAPPGRRDGMVILMPAGSSAGPASRPAAMAPWRPDGKFTVRGVPEGSYEALVESFGQEGRFHGSADIQVGDRHVDNVQITLQPGFDLAGALRIEGKEAAGEQGLDTAIINLVPRDRSPRFGGGAQGVRAGSDGHFLIRQMRAGQFDINVAGLPENHYVKAVRAGQADALAAGAHIVAGMQIDVVLSPGGARIDGGVTNEKGEAVTAASVVLLAKEGAAAPLHRRVRTVSLDQQGHFAFSGVAPGDYQLLALDESESGVYWDAEFLKLNDKSIEKVSVRENGAESKTLKLIVTGQ